MILMESRMPGFCYLFLRKNPTVSSYPADCGPGWIALARHSFPICFGASLSLPHELDKASEGLRAVFAKARNTVPTEP